MGSRYLVSGAQLGIIKGLAKSKQYIEIDKFIEELLRLNYVGNSQEEVLYDVVETFALIFDRRKKEYKNQ